MTITIGIHPGALIRTLQSELTIEEYTSFLRTEDGSLLNGVTVEDDIVRVNIVNIDKAALGKIRKTLEATVARNLCGEGDTSRLLLIAAAHNLNWWTFKQENLSAKDVPTWMLLAELAYVNGEESSHLEILRHLEFRIQHSSFTFMEDEQKIAGANAYLAELANDFVALAEGKNDSAVYRLLKEEKWRVGTAMKCATVIPPVFATFDVNEFYDKKSIAWKMMRAAKNELVDQCGDLSVVRVYANNGELKRLRNFRDEFKC